MIDSTVHSIIKACEIRGDNIHSDLQIKLESDPTYQGKYHTSYVTKYIITKATRSAEKRNELYQVHPIYMRRERDHLIGFARVSIVVVRALLTKI